jgi:hypothetical protein
MRTFLTLVFLILVGIPLIRAQQQSDCTCCSQEYRSFDFWIGEWEVTLPDGSPAGVNLIERIQDGCVLQEQWKSARQGFTGTSFTYFNRRLGQWEQLWVDNSGNILKLKGGLKGDAMVLSSEPARDPGGVPVINRITWSLQEDGRVRQHWEVLRDGAVHQVLFDGYYRKTGE